MSGVPYGDDAAIDTNTTYSVGDGGLTQNNFTTTLKNKLDNIAANANNYSLTPAEAGVLGGVKVGTNLTIDGSSVLHVTPSKAYATMQMAADSSNEYGANVIARFLDNLDSNGAGTPGASPTIVV